MKKMLKYLMTSTYLIGLAMLMAICTLCPWLGTELIFYGATLGIAEWVGTCAALDDIDEQERRGVLC